MDQSSNNAPAYSKKIGRVEGAVWINEGKNGPFYKATFNSGYEKDGVWKDSPQFSRADCRKLLLVVAAITTWMDENPLENADSDSDSDN